MRYLIYLILFLLKPVQSSSQFLTGLHSDFNDSFREWTILAEVSTEHEQKEIEGNLDITWGIGNDFSEWMFDIGDYQGDIKQKYKNDQSIWELRTDDEVITIKQVWPGDPSEWKITKGKQSIVILTEYRNNAESWILKNAKQGDFFVYTESRLDPRDWIIEDFVIDDISLPMRLAAAFIAIYNSIPKH